jgi:hypothetical protein
MLGDREGQEGRSRTPRTYTPVYILLDGSLLLKTHSPLLAVHAIPAMWPPTRTWPGGLMRPSRGGKSTWDGGERRSTTKPPSGTAGPESPGGHGRWRPQKGLEAVDQRHRSQARDAGRRAVRLPYEVSSRAAHTSTTRYLRCHAGAPGKNTSSCHGLSLLRSQRASQVGGNTCHLTRDAVWKAGRRDPQPQQISRFGSGRQSPIRIPVQALSSRVPPKISSTR